MGMITDIWNILNKKIFCLTILNKCLVLTLLQIFTQEFDKRHLTNKRNMRCLGVWICLCLSSCFFRNILWEKDLSAKYLLGYTERGLGQWKGKGRKPAKSVEPYKQPPGIWNVIPLWNCGSVHRTSILRHLRLALFYMCCHDDY